MLRGERLFQVSGIVASVIFAFSLVFAGNIMADEKTDQAKELADILRAARKVVSDNQELINNPSLGDKGLTGDKIIEDAKVNYKTATGADFVLEDSATLKGQFQQAVLDAVRQVMESAQPLINEQGKGFKGFIPAIFFKNVADVFNSKMQGKAFVKLTAPNEYVRNRANRPDTWEEGVMESKFKTSSWEKGAVYTEEGKHNGKFGLRLILPEYYIQSCLSCHGEPKGEMDITGGTKEGGKLGELGGAISIVIYN